jgi:hypothetical protein
MLPKSRSIAMARNILSLGGERQINLLDASNNSNGLAGSQLAPEITALPNGNFVVVYQSPWYANQSDIDLMWQEFRSDGTRLTGPNRLEFLSGSQLNPDVAARSNNGFVAVWEEGANIRLALVNPNTFSEPEPFLATTDFSFGSSFLTTPRVATLDNGSYFVAFNRIRLPENGGNEVYFIIVNAAATDHVKDVTFVAFGPGFQGNPDVAASGNNALVVWAEGNANTRDIKLALYGPTGTVLDTETVFDQATVGHDNPSVATLVDGRFIIVWRASTSNLHGRIYDPVDGTFDTGVFTVSSRILDQSDPSVAGLPDGGFIVSWTDNSHQLGDASGFAVHARRFDKTGAPTGDEYRVNTGTSADQHQSSIAANSAGVVFTVWTNLNTNNTTDTPPSGIQGQIGQTATQIVNGTPGNDVITTYGLSETINGLAGDDTIDGRGGNDIVNGGEGKDNLTGGPGADAFFFNVRPRKANIDHITDLTPGLDEIRLDQTIFKKLKLGELQQKAFFAKRKADEAHDKSDRIIVDTKSGKCRYDPDGTGDKKAKVFAILDTGADDIGYSDFVVVA